jgi:hypothetical protein
VVTGRHHIARSAVGPRLTFSPSAPALWGATTRLSGRSFCKRRLAIASSNVRPLQQISKTRLAQAAGDLPHKTSEPVLVFAPSSSSARSQIRPPPTGNNLSLARSMLIPFSSYIFLAVEVENCRAGHHANVKSVAVDYVRDRPPNRARAMARLRLLGDDSDHKSRTTGPRQPRPRDFVRPGRPTGLRTQQPTGGGFLGPAIRGLRRALIPL